MEQGVLDLLKATILFAEDRLGTVAAWVIAVLGLAMIVGGLWFAIALVAAR
jgi:hypothetical protein